MEEEEQEAPPDLVDTPIAAEEQDTYGFPPLYESGDDMEQASEYKMRAADLKSQGIRHLPFGCAMFRRRHLHKIRIERIE